jgi:glycerophosphoryl diester phosphodiesterase
MRELALRTGLQAVSVYHEGADDGLARDTRRSGLALYAWTPDTIQDIAPLIELGVDGVCTNFPDKAIGLLH